MDQAATEIEFGALTMGLLGGLAVFLYGMTQMTNALKSVAGGGMSAVLGKLTGNRFMAAITGAFVTGVIQSSSVTTVLVVGFISAGLMTLQQSVGVIMGANIGSTVTAQLVAFNITAAALPLITAGFGMTFLAKREKLRLTGTMLLGLGMIFLGMGFMSDATRPLREYEPFVDAMRSIDRPGLAILASAIFTAIVQSSAATTGLVIVLAGQGFISLEAGIALALGSNIGTCATALLAALGKPRTALQAAMAHILFNVLGVLIWMPFIGTLADWVRAVSPVSAELEGVARLAADTPRQVANAHTLFNVVNTVLFIWFTAPLAKLVQVLVPERPAVEPTIAQPLYLDSVFLETPALALDRIRMECGHLGEEVLETFDAMGDDPEACAANVADVASIHQGIVGYTKQLMRADITAAQAETSEVLLRSASHLYSVADTIAVNFRRLAAEAQERKLIPSSETRAMAKEFRAEVREGLAGAIAALRDNDAPQAQTVIDMKATIAAHADGLSRRLSERLAAPEPNRIEVFRLESEVIEIFKRHYYFAKRIAKLVVEPARETPEMEHEAVAA